MNDLIRAEIGRLQAGPQEGEFTFLHHDGPVVEKSRNVMERVRYILEVKAKQESEAQILARLRHIRFVPEELASPYRAAMAEASKAYDAAWVEASKAYDAAVAEADKEILALIPNCSWDSKTIFGAGEVKP